MSQVRRQPSEDRLSQRQLQQHHQPQHHQPHPRPYNLNINTTSTATNTRASHQQQQQQQQQHPSPYKAYNPYTAHTYTPYSPPAPADLHPRGAGLHHPFKHPSSPLMPAPLIPRDYLTQRADAASASTSPSETGNTRTSIPPAGSIPPPHHNNTSNYPSNFTHHTQNPFRSPQAGPLLSPIRTTTTSTAAPSTTTTLYNPKTRPHLSPLSPASISSSASSSQPPGSALTPRSPSLSQDDSPTSSSSPKSTPRAPRSATTSGTSPISPRSPSPPLSPLSVSTFARVSAFPVPPTTTTTTTTSSSIGTKSSNTDPIPNHSAESLQCNPAPPDRLTGSSHLRGANGNMPKSSSYDLLRKASDPPRPVTMNSNNNNYSNNNAYNSNNNTNSNNGGRRVTSPSSISPSPPLSNPALSSAVGDRIRTMPRTSSIDSAISSISSAHSHKSSLEVNNVTPEEIANLISTAGSAEAVIIHLLREKQQAASQNAQLWRLVDKQRTMVLGLNKDLERAMKDKDRYRKKLRELQANPPPIPERTAPVGGERPIEGDNNSSKDSPSGHDRTKSSDTTMRRSLDESPIFQSHSHLAHSHTDPQLTRSGTPSSRPSSPSDSVRTEQPANNDNHNHQQLRDSPIHPLVHGKQRGTANNTDISSSSTSAASLRTGDLLKQTPPPLRRPPPAPLNLSQTERVHAQTQRVNVAVGDDSDYEDNLETDGIPRMESRGRRKTREEDDRQREALLLQEKAARSASTKMKAKMAQPPEGPQKSHPPPQGVFGGPGPAGNRIVAHSPPPGLAQQISPLDSLASMLGPPANEATSSERDRLTLSPPMSPGLPLSPRPGDRPLGSPLPRFPKDGHGNMASPPMSPRNGLPLSPRATKFPAPPFSGPTNTISATTGKNSPTKPAETSIPPPAQNDAPRQEIPTFDASVKIDSPTSPGTFQSRIYRGLVSDHYPDLLLPPNALPSIDIKVSSSRLRPSRNSYLALKPTDEEPVFTLSVFSRANRAELWRVEKVIMALPQLDQQLKQALPNFTGRLPDRSIFSGHSPAKVDARRAALNDYFESILQTQMDDAGALAVCQFLTMDAIEPRDDETSLINGEHKGKRSYPLGPDGKPRIEGYLTKRGKNFGGWKARYFVLDGPELKYYESPGGPHMGTIKIHHAQIGKQSQSASGNQSPSRLDDDSDNQYRHAFLILEPKKKDSSALVRHVLCAESDEERDSWVEALLSYVEHESDEEENSRSHRQPSKPDGPSKSRLLPGSGRKNSKDTDSPEEAGPGDKLRSFSYDDVVAAEAPIRGPPGSVLPPGRGAAAGFPEPGYQLPWDQNMPQSPSLKSISGPTNGVKIQDAGAWGNKAPPPMTTKEKKRSIWGFRAASTAELANQIQNHEASSNNSPTERREAVRAVFGLPLAEAVEYCGVPGLNTGLPAVVYRCIDYLRVKDAALEEGIFRLSGSNVVIRALKEKFNTEGDLDFLEGDTYYDVHAVASLFKQYLRELPTTVLTRELHLDFIRVLDLDDKQKKIAAFNGLIHRLPRPNLTLLKALSQYLIDIISNSDVNKMTVRNVGIVFAPTLNIPAPVFSMFLTDFESIFGEPVSEFSIHNAAPTELPGDNKSLNPEDIRSPRHQMFSDLPTPSYNQSSFHQLSSAAPQHRHGSDLTPQEAQHAHSAQQQWDQQQDRDRSRDKIDNTGFIPMQPTYEQQMLGADPYNSMSSLMPPNNSNGNGNNSSSHNVTSKAKRRESNLLFMNLGKKSGMGGGQKGRDERSMVSEDSAFD